MPMTQVDEAAPLRGARPVRGTCESQPAAAEALRPHWQEVEQPPPDLQVGTPRCPGWHPSQDISPGLRPRASQRACLEGFLSQQHPPGCLAEAVCPHSTPTPALTRATHPRHTLVSLRRRPGPLHLLPLSPPSLPPLTHQQPSLASQAQMGFCPNTNVASTVQGLGLQAPVGYEKTGAQNPNICQVGRQQITPL